MGCAKIPINHGLPWTQSLLQDSIITYYKVLLINFMMVIRESENYIWLNFHGKTVKTTKNSIVHRNIEKLNDFLSSLEIKAFTSMEFREATGTPDIDTFKLLSQLRKQRVLITTKKRVLFRESTNLEHVWGLSEQDLLNYIIKRLRKERKDLVKDFYKLKKQKVLSSLEIKNPQQFRVYFVHALGIANYIKHQNYDIFYLGSREELQDKITAKEEEANYLITQKVKQGLKFEKYVEDFFRNHMHEITFRCISISRYVRQELREKVRVFDLILYFRAYIGNKELKGFPTLIVSRWLYSKQDIFRASQKICRRMG